MRNSWQHLLKQSNWGNKLVEFFNWQLWLVHMFMSLVCVLGYMAVHTALWEIAYGKSKASIRERKVVRVVIPAMAVGVFLTLCYGMYMDPMNELFYRNLQLVYVGIIILDDNLGLRAYLVRVCIYAVFLLSSWATGALTLPLLLSNLALLFVVCFIFRKYHDMLHYNYAIIIMVAVFIACFFWLPQKHLLFANALGAIANYFAMASFSFVLWNTNHNQDVQMGVLRQRADVDALTSVKTYSRFHDDIIAMVADAQERGTALTMVMLDIDHFKNVNDQYGHLSGNEVLIGVSKLLENVLNQHPGMHQIYRTGGEEFNIVFPDARPADVIAVVEDCWRQIRQHDFIVDGQHIRVTISVGVTALKPHEDYEETFKRADNNLYMSKRHGRDTITVDGVTEQLGDRQIAMFTYSYYTQAIVDMKTGQTQRSELLLRTFDEQNSRWILPTDFDISPATQADLLRRTLGQLKVQAMNINLGQRQFTDRQMASALVDFAQTSKMVAPLGVELTDLPQLSVMQEYSELYHAAGIEIYIDDVESAESFAVAKPYLPYVDGIKFVMQNARRDSERDSLLQRIIDWKNEARQYGLKFVLEGIESSSDVKTGLKLGITLGEGYYYSRPQLPYLR